MWCVHEARSTVNWIFLFTFACFMGFIYVAVHWFDQILRLVCHDMAWHGMIFDAVFYTHTHTHASPRYWWLHLMFRYVWLNLRKKAASIKLHAKDERIHIISCHTLRKNRRTSKPLAWWSGNTYQSVSRTITTNYICATVKSLRLMLVAISLERFTLYDSLCVSVSQFGQYIYIYFLFLAKHTHRRVEVIATLMVSIAQIEHEEKSLGLLTVEWPLYFVHFTFLVLPPCESFSTAFSKRCERVCCSFFLLSLCLSPSLSLSLPLSIKLLKWCTNGNKFALCSTEM